MRAPVSSNGNTLGAERSESCERGRCAGQSICSLTGRRVVALDQATGQQLWLITLNDTNFPGGTTPTALVYYDGLVYVGTGGGDAAYRGRAYALNATDGSIGLDLLGTAAPGTPGGSTWVGDSWRLAARRPWMHPAVDPELNIVYWTFGNPFPVMDGSTRGGDKPVLRFHRRNGMRTPYLPLAFQTVKHDLWTPTTRWRPC